MANPKAITVKIEGQYSDADVKRAIRDLESLRKQAPKTSQSMSKLKHELGSVGASYKEAFAGFGAGIIAGVGAEKVLDFFKSMGDDALEDEKFVRSLGITFRNLGIAMPVREATEFLDKLSVLTGVSKSQMEPSFQRLVTVLGDAEKAQSALKLAMDVSAGTGKDLDTVTVALAKAYAGNTTGLARLGAGIDAAIIRSGDMAKITEALSGKFAGQAAAAADSYGGKIARVSNAVELAKEKIGYELLGALDSLASSLGGADGATAAISTFGDQVAYTIDPVRALAEWVGTLKTNLDNMTGGMDFLQWMPTGLMGVASAWQDLGKATTAAREEAAKNQERGNATMIQWENAKKSLIELARAHGFLSDATAQSTDNSNDLSRGIYGVNVQAVKAASAVERLRAQLDALNGKNRSVIGSKIAFRRLLGQGPSQSGSRKGADGKTTQYATKDDRLQYALDLAQAAEDEANAYLERGNRGDKGRARQSILQARKLLRGQFGAGLTNSILSMPDVLKPGSMGQQAAGQRMAAMGGVTNNYYINGDWRFTSPADAVEQAKKAARLASLSSGRGMGPIGVTR